MRDEAFENEMESNKRTEARLSSRAIEGCVSRRNRQVCKNGRRRGRVSVLDCSAHRKHHAGQHGPHISSQIDGSLRWSDSNSSV